MTDHLSFGDYVRHLRRSHRRGLREAAKALGITPGHLSKIENSVVPPPRGAVIHTMADYYEVPLHDLLGRAKGRVLEAAEADQSLASIVAEFYRLAAGRAPGEQVDMLLGALDKLDLSPDEKRWWRARLEDLRAGGGEPRELLRLGLGANDLFDLAVRPRRLRAADVERMAESRLRRFFGGDLANYEPPTPIERIIEDEASDITLSTFGDGVGGLLPDGSPVVLGRSRWTAEGYREVGVHERILDSQEPAIRRRANFTLGHEFFHVIEHLPRMQPAGRANALRRSGGVVAVSAEGAVRRRRRLVTAEDWREWQANRFSAAILMPRLPVSNAFRDVAAAEGLEGTASLTDAQALQLSRLPAVRRGGCKRSLADLFDVNPRAMAIRLRALGLINPTSKGT